jgi:hypothetical protein
MSWEWGVSYLASYKTCGVKWINSNCGFEYASKPDWDSWFEWEWMDRALKVYWCCQVNGVCAYRWKWQACNFSRRDRQRLTGLESNGWWHGSHIAGPKYSGPIIKTFHSLVQVHAVRWFRLVEVWAQMIESQRTSSLGYIVPAYQLVVQASHDLWLYVPFLPTFPQHSLWSPQCILGLECPRMIQVANSMGTRTFWSQPRPYWILCGMGLVSMNWSRLSCESLIAFLGSNKCFVVLSRSTLSGVNRVCSSLGRCPYFETYLVQYQVGRNEKLTTNYSMFIQEFRGRGDSNSSLYTPTSITESKVFCTIPFMQVLPMHNSSTAREITVT